MTINTFNSAEFGAMLVGSANMLAAKKAEIDALNVFPVPDGDTGTNMYLTLLAGVKEAQKYSGDGAKEAAAAVARGCLLGARGNSGVILSQIMQGFADGLKGQEEVGTADVARAFREAARYAYRAVESPVEGTILTVMKSFEESFGDSVKRGYDLLRSMLIACKKARVSLEKTPEMLPVLKKAGVVDAGGKGLVVIFEGIAYALKMAAAKQELALFDLATSQQREFVQRADFPATIPFTYCTEFLTQGRDLPLERLRQELTPYGDCLMVVGGPDTVKVHIHSNHPGLVLECCLKYGTLHQVHINNMEEQHQEFKSTSIGPGGTGEVQPLAVVAVGLGEGINSILQSLGVAGVVPGGQTMNPSARDILEAVEKIKSPGIIIMPNNGNVLPAATQAADMLNMQEGERAGNPGLARQVAVVPTRTIPQGMAAMLSFNPYGEMGEVVRRMTGASAQVKTGEITRAVRDCRCGDLNIVSGDYIGLAEEQLVVAGKDLKPVLTDLVKIMLSAGGGLVTLYYGADVGGQATGAMVEDLAEKTAGIFPGVEFEYHYGGQPLYQFIISVE